MSAPPDEAPPPEPPAQAAAGDRKPAREAPSLWQLRVFEAVARLENVTKASQELLRSQPATTSCINAIEEALGATLFERSTTGIYLTPVGVAVLVRTRKVLAAAEDAVREVAPQAKIGPLALAGRITRTQMRCLIAIAECGSFRAAARSLVSPKRRCSAPRACSRRTSARRSTATPRRASPPPTKATRSRNG